VRTFKAQGLGARSGSLDAAGKVTETHEHQGNNLPDGAARGEFPSVCQANVAN